jgi:hypothetical protein
VQFYGWGFASRPGVLIIAALIAVSVWFGNRNRVDVSAPVGDKPPADPALVRGRPPLADRAPQIIFAALALGIFGLAIWDAMQQSFLGAVFPAAMASTAAFFGLMLLGVLILGSNANPAIYDHEVHGEHVGDDSFGSLWNGAFWIAFLVVLTALIGFYLALIAFFLAFLTFRARASLPMTLILTAAAATFLLALAYALSLNFPGGYLQSLVKLPWPIR